MKQKLMSILLAAFMFTSIIPSSTSASAFSQKCVEHQGEWQVVDKPSCYYEGTESRICENCGEREFRIVPATGHQWGEWNITKKPTCLTTGYKVKKCNVCGAVDQESISPTEDHNWGEWKIWDEPTCKYTGTIIRECTVCDTEEEQEIPKIPQNHSWNEWKIIRQATALLEGKKTRFCKYCDKEETKSTPKLKANVSLKEKSTKIESGKIHTIRIKSKTRGDKIKKWTSSNKAVATVDSNGKVTGKHEGTAIITLKMMSGVTSSCKIQVIKPTPISNSQSGSSSSQGVGNAGSTIVPSDTNSMTVYVTNTGEKYHKAGCRYLSRSQHAISRSDAQSKGYTPCSVCHP